MVSGHGGSRFKPQPQSDPVRPEKWNSDIVKYKREDQQTIKFEREKKLLGNSVSGQWSWGLNVQAPAPVRPGET